MKSELYIVYIFLQQIQREEHILSCCDTQTRDDVWPDQCVDPTGHEIHSTRVG